MAQLPTSFIAPQTHISDGSDLIRAAMMMNRDINDFGNQAFTNISDYAKRQANQQLANSYATGLANGLDPNAALKNALGQVNSWTSADNINSLLNQRNADTRLAIQQAEENRNAQDWAGQNEAAAINNLIREAYVNNNKTQFQSAIDSSKTLSDIAQKYIKMDNLAKQQDEFASAATSRAYTRALKDNLEDKKLASKLDAEFKIIESQNPFATKAQIAQAVAQNNGISPDKVNLILNEYGFDSGKSLLNEAALALSNTTSQEAIDKYNQAQENLQNYKVDIQEAIRGNTEQNKKDTNTAIDILSKELSTIVDEDGDSNMRDAAYSIGMPALTKFNEQEAKELVSNLLNNPSHKNFERIRNKLKAKGYNNRFVDWLNSNFILDPTNRVKLSSNTANNINNTLNQELLGNKTRKDILSESIVDSDRYSLGFRKVNQTNTYKDLLSLARKNSLSPEEYKKLNLLNAIYNQNNIDIGQQGARVAQAAQERFPFESTTQTINTFNDLVDSGKKLTTRDLVSKGFTEKEAEYILERIEDVKEEAQDSEQYKNIPLKAIIYAVLDKASKADSIFFSDKEYLKIAEQLSDKIPSIEQASTLLNKAKDASAVSRQVEANKYFSGQ